MICKFPSIENHYKSVSYLLGKQVYASEKIDGSNFSIHVQMEKG